MGINRWSDIEERKRIETKAKAGDEVPEGKKGDASSRLETSKDPAEDEEKRRVVEKLQGREGDSQPHKTAAPHQFAAINLLWTTSSAA